MKFVWFAGLLATTCLTVGGARAEEGMWTLDNLPMSQLKAHYDFTPTQAWVQHVMHASARLALGCSASFVSPDGLVMTNHHCANQCLADLSAGHSDFMQNGFTARSRSAEPKCPGMELNQLQAIRDVTPQMSQATAGKSGSDYIKAQHAAQSAIEKSCSGSDPRHVRCDVVTLYHGGRYALYRYKRFDDVRLSFAPDQNIAFFGGDPDNFNYPRYDLDVTFLRAYEDGRPAHTAYFPFDPDGPKAGELVITSGNPGSTDRDTTAPELTFLHDVQLPLVAGYYENLDGVLWEYGREGAEPTKEAADDVFGVENSLKVYRGWMAAFSKPSLMALKEQQRHTLLDWIDADPQRKATFGDPFASIAATIPTETALYPSFAMLEGTRRPLAFDAPDFEFARTLVRAAAERSKPDADRLPAYRDANLPAVEERLFSTAPIYSRLETTTLAFSLTRFRQTLGADDSTVRLALGKASPDALAESLVSGTRLSDVKVRRALWDGGEKAVEASDDPMIRFARLVDPAARAVRKRWEDEVEAPQRKGSELIAKARFAREGTSIYPDATFTERLSFGTVQGWNQDGHTVAPFTTFAGLYDRATGSAPFKLTDAWLRARDKLNLETPFDFVSSNDIIGGNSGSPVIDRNAHVVGLAFDGNQPSIAGNFVYDGAVNRTVAVDSAALLAALRQVYDDPSLADELISGNRAVVN
jgi:hypothetical protein